MPEDSDRESSVYTAAGWWGFSPYLRVSLRDMGTQSSGAG